MYISFTYLVFLILWNILCWVITLMFLQQFKKVAGDVAKDPLSHSIGCIWFWIISLIVMLVIDAALLIASLEQIFTKT